MQAINFVAISILIISAILGLVLIKPSIAL